jgi:Yip1-like protein
MVEENPGVASGPLGMFNAFVDPIGLAKRVKAKLFWLWPLITICIVYIVMGYLMLPYTMQLVDFSMQQRAATQSIPPERMETARNMAHTFSQVGIAFTPVFVVGILALLAWLVVVTGSMVGLRAKFRDVFSLMAACSLITSLQVIATYIVVRTKGDEIQSPEQLMAPFGADIFIQDVHGALLGFLNFFSIFEIWYLVILGLALAYLTGSSKGKAFAAITPAWVIPLLLVVVRAKFSPGASS